MYPSKIFSASLVALVSTLCLAPSSATAADLRSYHNSLDAQYRRAHSLGDNYQFDPRDGWQTVNVSDLAYKYKRSFTTDLDDTEGDPDTEAETLTKRAASKKKTTSHSKSKAHSTSKHKATSKAKSKPKAKTTSKAKTSNKSASSSSDAVVKGVSGLSKIIESIKAIGKPEPVTITWYTGHDLLNPSCWSKTEWAPTDASFAAALTLEGWTSKPECFKFLELCNSPKKCVYVRVVDSCAGCAKGSKHVDLTQAAFKELANLDTGLLTVQMRKATDPSGWLEDLWGPKA